MAWTAFPTWVVGQVSLASDWNTYVANNMQFLATPPFCKVYRQSATTGSAANPSPYDTVVADTVSGYSVSTFKYTVAIAGTYQVLTSWNLAGAADGAYLNVSIVHNVSSAGSNQGTQNGAAGNVQTQCLDTVNGCVVGDTLFSFYSGSASLAASVGGPPYLCYMTILKVSN